jgi:hypothetical protein
MVHDYERGIFFCENHEVIKDVKAVDFWKKAIEN